MDQRLERLEQIQKDMQDQLQAQLHEQLAKVQQDIRDQIQEPYVPPGFTPVNVQAQPDTYPRRVPVTIVPEQYQVGTSAPVNYLTGSGSNSGDNPTNPVVLGLDGMTEMDKAIVELPK
ncbi:cilia and flagella-associated protein 57-like [Gossypium australe]|uniref:Cilia and flagella-associated protein 57-like n=1 Tax=Gossypium australe TaxID=47621 RepID=A0A5B6WGQ7_9ROSI|nr:cilia and flagella-associated protein 57-like [Gossypium australe]